MYNVALVCRGCKTPVTSIKLSDPTKPTDLDPDKTDVLINHFVRALLHGNLLNDHTTFDTICRDSLGVVRLNLFLLSLTGIANYIPLKPKEGMMSLLSRR